jgi:hypothetical protein
MTIDTNTWHYKVYRWWYQRKHDGYSPDSANLCPYVRAVFLWSWMSWLFKGGRIWKVPVPAVAWSFLALRLPFWAGVFSYEAKRVIFMLYGVAGGAAVLVGIILGIIWLVDNFYIDWRIRQSAPMRAIRDGAELLLDYAEATHDRICPMIRFGNEAERD